MPESGKLEKGLKQRHMTMISLGGVIGAGLFVGSGAVMAQTGPATVLSYLAAGLLVVLVMRMLGEMAVADPTVGSFMEYSRKALGDRGGFMVGWLYWYFWAIVLAIEAVAGAEIMRGWIPEVPLWVFSLLFMTILTATNLVSVRNFGEFEFWFASIKVVAILAFILIAAGFLFGIGGGDSPGLSNLSADGGFFAAGGVTVLAGVVIVLFAFFGAEIVTIAAAESEEPEKNVARATAAIVWRVMIFYVLSVFLVLCVVPWDADGVGNGDSPFIAAMDRIGIPGAADIMGFIIITAVLSCLNSGIYTGSRMVFALARRGYAPQSMTAINHRGVPTRAILMTVSIGFACCIIAAIAPDTVFVALVNSSGAVALFAYVGIALSQIVLRRRYERDAPDALTLKMWFFPWLSYAVVAAMVLVIVAMAFVDDVRAYLWWSLGSLAIVGAAAVLRERRGFPTTPREAPGTQAA